jgi:dephospho-CoA kinase
MKVIGVTGMPGSGKGIVAGIARTMGVELVRMGDIIRDEAQKRNAAVGEVAVKLREEQGKFVVAERCVAKIKQLEDLKMGSDGTGSERKNRFYMIEGIRSPYEIEVFKKNFNDFKVIAVYSTPKTRFKRLKRRMRFDDSAERSEFEKRDKRELKFGIGNVIATSDYMVVNQGSINKFKSVVRSILQNEMQNEC